MSYDKRILNLVSCIIEFINLLAKEIKCEACQAFYLFSTTRLINAIKHEHSCKILSVFTSKKCVHHYKEMGQSQTNSWRQGEETLDHKETKPHT